MTVADYQTPDADGDMELYDEPSAKSPLFTRPRFPSRFSTLTDDQFDDYMNGHFLIPSSPSSIPQPDPVDDQFISFPHLAPSSPRYCGFHPCPHVAPYRYYRYAIEQSACNYLDQTLTHHVTLDDWEDIFWTFDDLNHFHRS